MGYAADDIDASVERAKHVIAGRWAAVETVLRKSDELQVDVGRYSSPDFEKGIDSKQSAVADVDMGANGKQAHRNGPVAIGKGSLHHRLGCEQRLELAPEGYSFQQRSGFV